MNAPAHAFPLPQSETSKLEIVTEEIRHQPVHKKVKDFVRTNLGACILFAAAAGFLVGAKLSR